MLAGGLALLLTGALLASTAVASRVNPQHTRYRYFQDLTVTGAHTDRIVFAVLFANRKGNSTREMVSYDLRTQVSCNPGGVSELGIGGNAFAKYSYFMEPLTNGHWAHRFEDQFENAQAAPLKGDLSGTVLERLKRGGRVTRTARVDGAFDIQDWDPYGLTGVQETDISSGSYSATPCKRRTSPRAPNYSRWKRWKMPSATRTPGSQAPPTAGSVITVGPPAAHGRARRPGPRRSPRPRA